MGNEKEIYQRSVSLRQKLNYDILAELYLLVDACPTLRFGQILSAFLPMGSDSYNKICPTVTAQEWLTIVRTEEPSEVIARYARVVETKRTEKRTQTSTSNKKEFH